MSTEYEKLEFRYKRPNINMEPIIINDILPKYGQKLKFPLEENFTVQNTPSTDCNEVALFYFKKLRDFNIRSFTNNSYNLNICLETNISNTSIRSDILEERLNNFFNEIKVNISFKVEKIESTYSSYLKIYINMPFDIELHECDLAYFMFVLHTFKAILGCNYGSILNVDDVINELFSNYRPISAFILYYVKYIGESPLNLFHDYINYAFNTENIEYVFSRSPFRNLPNRALHTFYNKYNNKLNEGISLLLLAYLESEDD